MLKATASAAMLISLAYGGCAGEEVTQGTGDGAEAKSSAASPRATSALARPQFRPHIVIASVRKDERAAPKESPYGVTRRDFDQIQQTVPTIRVIVPVREVRRQVEVDDLTSRVQILGTTPEYSKLHPLVLTNGRFLTQEDIDGSKQVAVVSEQVIRDLMLSPFPVGKDIQVEKHSFRIVGTIDGEGSSPKSSAQNRQLQIYLPVTTMRAKLGDKETVHVDGRDLVDHFELSRIEILMQRGSDILQTKAAIGRLLNRLHTDDSYTIESVLDE